MGFLSAMGNFFSDVGTDFHDAAVSPFGGDTNAQQEAAQRSAEAAKQAEAERKKLAADNKGLDFGGGFDPASITQHENWQSYSHQQLYDTNQHSIQQGEATEVAHAWRSIAGELKKIGPGLQHDVGTALQDGWEGEAADAAKQAGEPLARWSDEHGEALHMTGNRIEQAASAAGQVKESVPPPQEPSVGRQVAAGVLTGPVVPGVGAAADGVMQMQQRQEDTRKAQETMGRVMTPTYHNVDTTVPAFKHVNGQPAPPPSAPAPGSPSAPPSPGHGGAAGGGAHVAGGHAAGHPGGGGAASPHHVGPGGHGGPPARTGSASAGPAAPPGHPGAAPPPQGGQGAPVEGMMPVPPGAAAGAGGAGAGGGGRTGGVGGKGGGAGGGKAGGAAASGKGGQLGPGGRAGSGGTGGGAAQGGASGSAGAAGGRGGAAGGGMSPGAGRGGGQENEHERPTWLEEHDDVWLNDMPRTAPPVFGA